MMDTVKLPGAFPPLLGQIPQWHVLECLDSPLPLLLAQSSPLSPPHGSHGGFSERKSESIALRKDGLIERVFRPCLL